MASATVVWRVIPPPMLPLGRCNEKQLVALLYKLVCCTGALLNYYNAFDVNQA